MTWHGMAQLGRLQNPLNVLLQEACPFTGPTFNLPSTHPVVR